MSRFKKGTRVRVIDNLDIWNEEFEINIGDKATVINDYKTPFNTPAATILFDKYPGFEQACPDFILEEV